jgi:hypothetical protein
MTDQIVRSLWNFKPPAYLVATATVHLPIRDAGAQTFAGSESEVLKRIRDWRFSPERLSQETKSTPAMRALIRDKSLLLSENPPSPEKPAWHQRMQQLNKRIQQQLGESESTLQESLEKARNRRRVQQVQTSREFSLALFPSDWIFDRLNNLCSFD